MNIMHSETEALNIISKIKCLCALCSNLQKIAAEQGLQAVVDHKTLMCSKAFEIKHIASEVIKRRDNGIRAC